MSRGNGFRNVDELINYYEQSRRVVIDLLSNYSGPEKSKDLKTSLSPDGPLLGAISSTVEVDKGCMRLVGKGNHNSPYSCVNCLEIGRLASLKRGTPKAVGIEAGQYGGDNFTIEEEKSPKYEARWDLESKQRVALLNNIHGLSKCGLRGAPDAEYYLSCDNWLNGVIVNWVIESIYHSKSIPHIEPVLKAFVCGSSGYKIRKITAGRSESIPLVELCADYFTPEFVLSLFRQIAAALVTLRPYQFVHGSATIDKLRIQPHEACGYLLRTEPTCSLSTEGYHEITGNHTLKLDGFHLSSICLEKVRVIPSVVGRDVNLSDALRSFRPTVISKVIPGNVNLEYVCRSSDGSIAKCSKNTYIFRTGEGGATLFTTMRYSGYPLFGGAFDTYSFLVSLMSYSPISSIIKNSDRLTAIWTHMFPHRDKVPQVSSLKPITCSYEISRLIGNNWLYCDAPERLLLLCDKFFPT